MKVTYWKGVFVADHAPPEEKLLKQAGFKLHEPSLCEPSSCRACDAKIGRRYWSNRVEEATRLRAYCTKRALSVMREHLSRLAQSRAVDARIDVPSPPGLSYLPYQRAGIAYALQHKDTLFGDDMGLGKTVEALGVVNALHPRRILIVAPATLALNWRAEAEKWLVDQREIMIPCDTKVQVQQSEAPLVVITNYEKITGNLPRPRNIPTESIVVPESVPPPADAEISLLVEKLQKQEPAGRLVVLTSRNSPHHYVLRSNPALLAASRKLTREHVSAIVLPPDALHDDESVSSYLKTPIHTPLSKSLLQPWDMAIFDEAQALKNPDSLRSRAVLGDNALYRRSRRSLFLSGTPMENCPKEIWPIAATVCPAKFGDWWAFAQRYCGLHVERHGKRKVLVATGSTHALELQQRLRTSFMIRRLKSDVLRELPPKRRQLIVLDEEVDWSQYPELQRWKELHLGEYVEALARLEAARTLADYHRAVRELNAVTASFEEMSDLRHKTALLKLPACLRLTDELLRSGLDSLVIFAHHRDVLQKTLEHYGDEACVIYGDTPIPERHTIVQAFQAGRYRMFIGGLKAAGTGLTLTRASTGIFFETDWNPATTRQAEDRMDRIGQKRMVHIIHPVLNGSLDANMIQKMVAKQEMVDKVLDRLPEMVRIRERQVQI